MNENERGKVHWSFWAISAVGLVFNLMGCANFISQLSPEMVASMPAPIRVIVETRPAWATGAFAIAVFGGALGGILLLLRRSSASYMFVASFFGCRWSAMSVLRRGRRSGRSDGWVVVAAGRRRVSGLVCEVGGAKGLGPLSENAPLDAWWSSLTMSSCGTA